MLRWLNIEPNTIGFRASLTVGCYSIHIKSRVRMHAKSTGDFQLRLEDLRGRIVSNRNISGMLEGGPIQPQGDKVPSI